MWLVLWVACMRGGGPMKEFGGETGFVEGDVDVDVDTEGETDAVGDAVITLRLSGFEESMRCADAGVTEVTLSFRTQTLTVPCDDAPVTWYDIPAVEGALSARGDTIGGAFYAGFTDVSIVADRSSPIEVVLVCDDNGILDGCGGA